MDIIIRAIIQIFKEVFEKDTERRRKEQGRRQEIIRQWQARRQAESRKQGRQGANPTAPQPRSGGAPSAQLPPQGQQPQQARPKPEFQRQIEALFGDLIQVEPEPPPPPPPPPELPPPKPKIQRTQRSSKPNRSYRPKKGKGYKVEQTSKCKKFKLPGKTSLEQMIFAKVILDPCKAIQDDRTFF